MPRNMIEANQRLFGRLADAGGQLLSSELRLQKRAVQTDADEKQWLRQLKVWTSGHLLLGGASKIAMGDFNGDLYLIAIGLQIVDPPAELERVEVNAGIFTATVSELEVGIIPSSDVSTRLLEYVFYPVENGIELLDIEVIRPFFQPIEIYRVDRASALAIDPEFGLRAATAAVLCSPSARSLVWPQSSLDRLRFMVRDPAERAPFHLLLRALTEKREDAAFLAMYRCMEQLFPVPKIAELSAELKLSGAALGIASTIERFLGWRRREEDAIAHLFGELDATLVDRMVGVVGIESQEGNRSKLVSRRVYELRNQCVHYRPAHASDTGSGFGGWLTLADLMLEAVQSLYARYAIAFDAAEAKT
jgi:hypothetical protein